MKIFEIIHISLTTILIIVTFLPLSKNKHWLVRGCDFARIQVLVMLLICLFTSIFLFKTIFVAKTVVVIGLVVAILFQLKKLFPYINFGGISDSDNSSKRQVIRLLSINVYQFNKNYSALVNLVHDVKPDIFLAMETDSNWEKGLEVLDHHFADYRKIPLSNTYGMFLYSNLKTEDVKTHFFINDERPTIEALMQTNDGVEFVFYGFHPPPPSPTEEKTAKKKDGELMILAKRLQQVEKPAIVVGDFNTVCWSDIAQLFSKVSNLADARKGRGFYSTFPVKPSILRVPIDLVYHSNTVLIRSVKTLKDVGSDHLPFLVEFEVNPNAFDTKSIESEKIKKADDIIEEGKVAEREE